MDLASESLGVRDGGNFWIPGTHLGLAHGGEGVGVGKGWARSSIILPCINQTVTFVFSLYCP